MLVQRVLSALVGLPLLVAAFATNLDWVLFPLFLIFLGISTYEISSMILPTLYRRLSTLPGDTRPELTGRLRISHSIICVCISMLIFISSQSMASGRQAIVAGVLLAILAGAFAASDNEGAGVRILGYLLSVTYGSLPWIAIWELYKLDNGSSHIIFLLAVVWSGDTAAYFGGSAFGRHKLAPRMSPRKTWEGAVFGLLGSLVGGCTANIVYQSSLGSWTAVLVACLIGGAAGQMGDLVESTLKRFCHVKDSSHLIPGHGGFLDRVDGLLFAGPMIWFVFVAFKPLA